MRSFLLLLPFAVLSGRASPTPSLFFQNSDSSLSNTLELFAFPNPTPLIHSAISWLDTKLHPALPTHKLRLREPKGICESSEVNQKSGYLDVDDKRHFYFYFFESRSKPQTDPLILWLNGGPGCSSATGLYMELGPCRVNMNGNGTTINPDSWNSQASIIFLDQPVGAGFSYGTGDAWTSADSAKDIYSFLQVFFENFPEYRNLDFHIWGESYAGHYIPTAAAYINDQNKAVGTEGYEKIHLKSVGIGNGLTNPLVQMKYFEPMACGKGGYPAVISEEECKKMEESYPTCRALSDICYAKPDSRLACIPSQLYCNAKMMDPFTATQRNVYDMRMKCDPNNPSCYPILDAMSTYLNKEEVKEELGIHKDHKFTGCSDKVNLQFLLNGDSSHPDHLLVAKLLADGIRVLIYAGDKDYICNWLGNKAWTLELEWEGKSGFQRADDLAWYVNGKQAGEVRTFENFSFLKVYDAGHMVPYDQGPNALDMVNRWMANKSFANGNN